MRISDEGVAAIYRRECKPPRFEPELTAYDDGSGNWTIGCGHSGPDVTQSLTITREQADALFRKDILPCEAAVNASVTVPLTQNQFDALCSFAFNIGVGAFQNSTLVKKINAKASEDQIAKEFSRWNQSGGNVNAGLVNRRNSEIGQWTRGAFVSSASVPVDPPPRPWQQLHNWLTGSGLLGMFGSVAADKFTEAGHDFQALASNWHGFALIGGALIVMGIVWKLRSA